MGNDVAQSTNLAPGDLNMIQAIRQGFGVRVSEGAEVMVQVVQLVRAAGCGSEGQWFEPVLAPPDLSTPDHPNPLSYWTNAAIQQFIGCSGTSILPDEYHGGSDFPVFHSDHNPHYR